MGLIYGFINLNVKGHLNGKKMGNFKTLKINQICYKYFNVIYQNFRNDVLILSRSTHEIAVHNDRS